MAAFNALLKYVCPQLMLQLVIMTADTFDKRIDFQRCTYRRRNDWQQQQMQGGGGRFGDFGGRFGDFGGRFGDLEPEFHRFTTFGEESDQADEESRLDVLKNKRDVIRQQLDAKVPGWSEMSSREKADWSLANRDRDAGRLIREEWSANEAVLSERERLGMHLYEEDYRHEEGEDNQEDDEEEEEEEEEEEDHDEGKNSLAIGFFLVERGASCVASIELDVEGSSDRRPRNGHRGSIFAATHEERRRMDMYSLVMAATVLYTASFAIRFPKSAAQSALLSTLHSQAIVVPSMWVLRPYAWVLPTPEQFDKIANDTYAAYENYYNRSGRRVHIEFRPSDNVEAAGRVLRSVCTYHKFCHSQPRLVMPFKNPRVQNPRVQNPQVQKPQVQKPRVQNPQVQKPRVQNPRVKKSRVTKTMPMVGGKKSRSANSQSRSASAARHRPRKATRRPTSSSSTRAWRKRSRVSW